MSGDVFFKRVVLGMILIFIVLFAAGIVSMKHVERQWQQQQLSESRDSHDLQGNNISDNSAPSTDSLEIETDEKTSIYPRVRDMYIAWHATTYPDCTEHEAVLADAKRYAKWVLVDQYPKSKSQELTDEAISLLEKYNYSPAHEATHIPESERLNDVERIKFLMAEIEAYGKRKDTLERQRPIQPKPRHTH